MKSRVLCFPLAALLLTACSAQKGSDYAGEPLARVRGTITSFQAAPPAEAQVVLVWNNFAKNGDTFESATLPARGDFPAKFTLDIFAPPSPAQLNDFGKNGALRNEARFGVSSIYALPPGATVDTKKTPILGVVEDFVVVYVEDDMTPGSKGSTFLGGALSKGFHLMKVTHRNGSDGGAALTACYRSLSPDLDEQERYARCHGVDVFDKLTEAEQGFDTEVTLKLADDKDLDVPNYN